MEYTLKIIPEKNGCRYLLCDVNGNYFALSKMAHDILSDYKQTSSYASVLAYLKSNYPDISITESNIENAISSIFSTISKNQKRSYIHQLFPVLRSGKAIPIYRVLGWLFHPLVLMLLLPAAIILSFGNYVTLKHLPDVNDFSIFQVPIYYGIFMLILLLHELGHATAAFYYGVRPKGIGFGLYFIFPVLFTNVTNIWELNTRRRLVVNSAGIYFQLLVNMLLTFLIQMHVYMDLLQRLFVVNSISILIALVPFIRYDGYWIMSDLLQIPNLQKKAKDFVIHFISRPSELKKYKFDNKSLNILMLYTVLYAIFWALLYLCLSHFIATSISSFSEDMQNTMIGESNKSGLIAERICILLCISVIAIVAFCRFLISIYHANKKQSV